MVFLLAMTGVLGIYILTQSLSQYAHSTEYADAQSNRSIDCVGYIYSVSQVSYEGGRLSLDFRNEAYSNSEVNTITVITDSNQSREFSQQTPPGADFMINAQGIDIAENFTIYPDNCAIYAKTCYLDSGECRGYAPKIK